MTIDIRYWGPQWFVLYLRYRPGCLTVTLQREINFWNCFMYLLSASKIALEVLFISVYVVFKSSVEHLDLLYCKLHQTIPKWVWHNVSNIVKIFLSIIVNVQPLKVVKILLNHAERSLSIRGDQRIIAGVFVGSIQFTAVFTKRCFLILWKRVASKSKVITYNLRAHIKNNPCQCWCFLRREKK